jgi:hypothetical protein
MSKMGQFYIQFIDVYEYLSCTAMSKMITSSGKRGAAVFFPCSPPANGAERARRGTLCMATPHV